AAAGATWVLFAGRFLVGLGATVTFVGLLKIASEWFPPSRVGTLSALSATVGILGSLTAIVPLAWLASAAGWRGSFVLIGVGALAAAGLCAWVVRARPGGGAACARSSGRCRTRRGTRRPRAGSRPQRDDASVEKSPHLAAILDVFLP